MNKLTNEQLGDQRTLEMLSTALGGAVATLLADPHVEEIRVNPDGALWYDKDGLSTKISEQISIDQRMQVIGLVANHVGTVVNAENPSFGGELPESGYRFQAVIPPQSPEGPLFLIRRKPVLVYTLEDYVTQGVMTEHQMEIVKQLVRDHTTILVSGPTRSGKTTFANAIGRELGREHHRIVCMEDDRELVIHAPEVIYLRAVKVGDREIRTMSRVLQDILRCSPHSIVIGEVRGLNVVDMMNAWNTGHEGGLGTIHANSAADTLPRIEDLVKLGDHVPVPSSIARAVQAIIQLGFVREAGRQRRRVKEIVRVDGTAIINGKTEYVLTELTKRDIQS